MAQNVTFPPRDCPRRQDRVDDDAYQLTDPASRPAPWLPCLGVRLCDLAATIEASYAGTYRLGLSVFRF